MSRTHLLSNHILYHAHYNMKDRCYSKNHPRHRYYKDIAVCKEWRNDFMAFYYWAIFNGWEEGLTLDRIDNNGDYEPSNCRWATRLTQSHNRGEYTLNIKQVKLIKALLFAGCTPIAIARELNIDRYKISHINTNIDWKTINP